LPLIWEKDLLLLLLLLGAEVIIDDMFAPVNLSILHFYLKI
jgi:hypothetical protein